MMKIKRIISISNMVFWGGIMTCFLWSCNPVSHKRERNHKDKVLQEAEHHDDKEHVEESLRLTNEDVEALALKIDTLPLRNMGSHFFVNGWLDVPKKDRAAVTTFVGANVSDIRVQEGDYVRKGAILAALTHPDLIRLQTDYYQANSNLQLLKQEYERQNRLYEGAVASGKQLEQSKSAYLSIKNAVLGQSAQLKLMGLDPNYIKEGNVYNQIFVRSPISGFVEKINVKTGLFASPQTELFEVVNTTQIHADLIVFEKDIQKVKVGQLVEVSVQSPDKSTLKAHIYAIGKTFEKDPKGVHIHARFEDLSKNNLLPGMYVTGKIEASTQNVPALPEEAIVSQDGLNYAFAARQENTTEGKEWELRPIQVHAGLNDEGWVQIKLLEALQKGEKIVLNQAYYLISEMNKGNVSHEH